MRGSEAAWRSRAATDLGVGGAVVDQAQLPVVERLLSDGRDRLLEHMQGRVVDRRQHRDQRRIGRRQGVRGRAALHARGWARDRLAAMVADLGINPDRTGDQWTGAPAARFDPQL